MKINITPTNLISSAATILIGWIVGLILLAAIAMGYFKVVDGFDNYQRYQTMGIVEEARVHIFDGRYNGDPITCAAVERDSGISWADTTVLFDDAVQSRDKAAAYAFCNKLMYNSTHWKDFVVDGKNSIGENIFWTTMFVLLYVFVVYMLAIMVGSIVAMMTKSPRAIIAVILFCLVLPVSFMLGIFLSSAWTDSPNHWVADGYSVETHLVFIDESGLLYKAPDTLYDWSDSGTLRTITTGYERW